MMMGNVRTACGGSRTDREELEIPKQNSQRKVSGGGEEVGGDSRKEVVQFQAVKHGSSCGGLL